jgi:uncharacterized membrane protein YphA (DoxX/SURF4 family)
MNTILWVLQGLVALTFLYSGICKSIYSERVLVTRGQTGVEGLSLPLIRFIGISEILGSAGLLLPQWLQRLPVLTPVAALCLGVMMIPAAVIHAKRNEYRNVITNVVLLALCLLIAAGRF